MNLFDLFRKYAPDDVLRTLRHRIVISALTYRKFLDEPNNEKSSNAGAELVFLLLHLVDVAMFGTLGQAKRDLYFDRLALEAIRDYSAATLRSETPEDLKVAAAHIHLRSLNSRQISYSRCKSVMGDGFPGAGSMVFAFCFFVYRVLGRTERATFDEILAGSLPIQASDLRDFPDVEHILRWTCFLGPAVKELQIEREVRKLK